MSDNERYRHKKNTQDSQEIKMEVFKYLPCVRREAVKLISFDIGLTPSLPRVACLPNLHHQLSGSNYFPNLGSQLPQLARGINVPFKHFVLLEFFLIL